MRTDLPRLGIPTASNFHWICTQEGRRGDSRERRAYLHRLVYEKITGEKAKEKFQGNEYTEDGINNEEPAARALSLKLGVELLPGCFITTKDGRFGCSPDRFIRGRHEGVEIKAPAGWTHIGFMIDGPGNKYKPQVQGQLLVSGFDRMHFWSWNPNPLLKPVYIEVMRDGEYIRKLRGYLDEFAEDLDKAESYVRRAGNLDELELHLTEAGEIYLQ